jgi:serine/threonine protein kinase
MSSSEETNSSSEEINSSSYDSENSSELTDSSNFSSNNDNLDLSGKLLNKYNIIYEIGRGADAIVWLAFCIEDSKFYAIKVNEPGEYKKGLEEFKFIKKLPPKLMCFNHLKESFVEQFENKKYACGVFELHTGNLDAIVRKGEYLDGLPIIMVKKIMYQLFTALKYLHQKMKVYHADIKTDNILLKGFNNYDMNIMQQYNDMKFFENYKIAKEDYWTSNGKKIENIDKIKKEEKLLVREKVHKVICDNLKLLEKEEKYKIKNDFLLRAHVSLSDFGAWCGEEEHYESDFGTRYYRAPEILLLGETGYPVDIWATGCVFYELLTGRILFDPEKDSTRTRDEYHLYEIQKLCGEYSMGFIKKTKCFKKYFDKDGKLVNFKDINDENRSFTSLLDKYKINEEREEILELLKGMLTISPKQRWTVDKCLSASFFKNL